MSSLRKGLVLDYSRYLKSFQIFLERSSEHQCMLDFFREILPDFLASIGEGKPTLHVIGVGCGTGQLDQEILSQLCDKHPHVDVEYDVVEPSSEMLQKFKERSLKTPNLKKINFTWNEMTSSEFEKQWKEKQSPKSVDFIHMIQMLYYVADPGATVSFFQSLLNKNGKLLIILASGEGGWGKLWSTYREELSDIETTQYLTAWNIKEYLNAKGISFKSFVLPSTLDITECFIPGDEKGELLLDFLTEVQDFANTASPELKSGFMTYLRHPDCSTEVNGRVIFNNNLEALIVEP